MEISEPKQAQIAVMAGHLQALLTRLLLTLGKVEGKKEAVRERREGRPGGWS